MKAKLLVENMNCNNCKKHVKEALEKLSGIQTIDINLEQKEVTIDFDIETLTKEQIIEALENINYHAKFI